MRTFNSTKLLLVCLVLIQPLFAEELYGIFMIVKGTVEIESTKTGKALAKVGAKVYPGDKISTLKDARAKIVMSDRNVMNLSPESVMTILKYENDPKSNVKNVELELSQGKVRNNVEQKYDGDKSKFIIKTPTAVAGVRGTQFLTSFDVKTRMTEIVTFKGAVQMAPILANGQVSPNLVIVKKGETSSVKQGQDNAEPPKALPKEDIKKADKDSQAKGPQPSEGASVADSGDKAGGDKRNDKDTKKDKDGKVASNEKNPSNDGKREPASEGKGNLTPSEPMMIDKRDMDLGAAKDIKPPIVVDAPPMQPTMPRLPPTIGQPQQIPGVEDIIRSKLNKTKVIIRPVLPQQ